MIIDVHVHIWKNSIEKNKAELLKACEVFNISRIYVSGLGSHYPDQDEISGLNLEVAKFIREHPDKIGGYSYISPVHPNCLDELKKGIEEYGMSGMKLWVATFCDDRRVFPLVEQCIEYNVPILIHAFHKAVGQLPYETTGIQVAALAKKYPQAKIIFAHLGGNCYHGIKAIRDCKNVWADFSGSIFRRDDIDYAVEQIGAERILFGTDMCGGSFLINKGQVEEASLTDEQRELIYYRNALYIMDRTKGVVLHG